MKHPATKRRSDGATEGRRAFSLTELMVAVAVLVVVIIATSRIFGTVNRITAIGTATADVLQDAAAIERQIRGDFERLCTEGFFAIQSHAVSNDIHVSSGGSLLNPNLARDAIVRADQLVFFTQGRSEIQTFRLSASANAKGQGTVARIYYGHGYQLPRALPYNVNERTAHDVAPFGDERRMSPWWRGEAEMVFTTIKTGSGTDNYMFDDAEPIDASQPLAPQWILVRQSAALADDDQNPPNNNSKTVFLNNNMSARSIFIEDPSGVIGLQPQLRDGRADAAATQLNDIYNLVTAYGTNSWLAQRVIIINRAMFFPRVERFAPSTHRVDQALTNHAISSACSSFIVEWTWDFGDGAVINDATGLTVAAGVFAEPRFEQPWFGYPDAERGVTTYIDWNANTGNGATTVAPDNIEFVDTALPEGTYTATFGYNQDRPYDLFSGDPSVCVPDQFNGALDACVGFTPWPSAVRITMVLHDAQTRLEAGRTFQFVVRLPKREQ